MPISFGSGCTKNTRIMPPRISTGIISHGSAMASWPVRCAIRSASHITSGLNTMPTSEPVATKPSARPRCRGGYMSVAATRNCCAALMPLAKITMPSVSPMALPASIARPVAEGADHRQPLAEQDAGLAAVVVGDPADRIGDQEAADAEQADREAGEARRAGDGDHHQRADAIGELRARADEGLRQREQPRVALDQRRDAAEGSGNGLVHYEVASCGCLRLAPAPAPARRTPA